MKLERVSLRMIRESNIEYTANKISSTEDVVKLIDDYEELSLLSSENVLVICLNNKNKPNNYAFIARGTMNDCIVDPREVMKVVLLSNSTKFILVHNHTSGDPTPSEFDYNTTARLETIADIMGIKLLDHIVVGYNGNYAHAVR